MFLDIFISLQLLGIVASAISGVMVASERHLDLFGALVLGCVTAVGGGIIRDLLLGITPPQMFRDPTFILLALGVSMVTVLILYYHKLKYLSRTGKDHVNEAEPGLPPVYDFILNTVDSLGLAVFAISGVQTVFNCGYEHSFFLSMFIGLVTAVGGGVLRDILAGKTPVILRKRIYALAALAGCLLYYICFNTAGLGVITASVISIIFMVMIRHLSYIFKWDMPSL